MVDLICKQKEIINKMQDTINLRETLHQRATLGHQADFDKNKFISPLSKLTT